MSDILTELQPPSFPGGLLYGDFTKVPAAPSIVGLGSIIHATTRSLQPANTVLSLNPVKTTRSLQPANTPTEIEVTV